MYDRILVPLDGSSIAEQVLPTVTRISEGLGTPIELFRVFSPIPPEMSDAEQLLYTDRLSTGFRDEAIGYLEKVRGAMGSLMDRINCNAKEGDAASQIVDTGDASPNTLIAMSTHGRSGLARWVMGSVTDKVLHGSGSALLIVRAVPEEEYKKEVTLKTVIVPVDGSPLAEQILPHATALAMALELNVVLLRCLPTSEGFAAFTGMEGFSAQQADVYNSIAEQAGADAMTYLNQLADQLRGQGVANVETRLERGSPGLVIVDVAQETQNNLVAMTTHGRSGVARWTMGSVADRVVRHSGDPVLLVRAT